jgi:hypothetical protein
VARRLGATQTAAGLALPAAGSAITILAAYIAVSHGATVALEVLAVLLLFVGSVAAFLITPHRAVAGTVVVFAVLPALKVFISPSIGGVKDVVCLGGFTAAAILVTFDHRRMDGWTASLIALFLGIYIVNPGHGHGSDWLEGLRLTGEPVLLLVVGFVLPDPRRNLRWGLLAMAATGVVVSLYGVLQQVLGIGTLESLGYTYGEQIRTIGSNLRSFGTLDDPFNYAAFLYLALAAGFWSLRKSSLVWIAESIIVVGLLVSFVRTAALVLLGFVMLTAIHRRLTYPALALGSAVAVIAALTLSHSSGIETQAYEVYYTNGGSALISRSVNDPGGVLLNGRISAWTAAVGPHPIDWLFGRGVGEVGTAAQRASVGVLSTASSAENLSTTATAVDSGYLATVADVGVVGLVLELALFARLITLGVRHVRRGDLEGWLPVTLLSALMLDALTRASFTGFPSAFLGLLLVGLSIAALEASPSPTGVRPRSRALAPQL